MKNSDREDNQEADDGTLVPVAEAGRIEHSEEYRLMLHRHWSFYDALYYSDHVAARVGTWRADGQNKLMRLLAKRVPIYTRLRPPPPPPYPHAVRRCRSG